MVTNHKLYEREVVPQYQKLAKKARTGARFVINQIGYNARKDDELVRYISRQSLPVRALANVYLLSRPAARAFHAGKIPGVVVTDDLLDAGRSPRRLPRTRGARSFSTWRPSSSRSRAGLGFNGAYPGGHATAETFFEILERADAYRESDWRELSRELRFGRPDEFYLFELDSTRSTGLSSDELNPAYVKPRDKRRTALRVPLAYRFSRLRPRYRVGFLRGPALHRCVRCTRRSTRRRAGRPRRPRPGAGRQGADVRLPRLRRLLAA